MANAVKPNVKGNLHARCNAHWPADHMDVFPLWVGITVAEGASPVAPALVATTHENSVAHFASAIWIIWTTWRGVPALLSCLPFATTQASLHSTHLLTQSGWQVGAGHDRLSTSFRFPNLRHLSFIPSPRFPAGSRSKMRAIHPSDPSPDLCFHSHSLLALDRVRICFATRKVTHSTFLHEPVFFAKPYISRLTKTRCRLRSSP